MTTVIEARTAAHGGAMPRLSWSQPMIFSLRWFVATWFGFRKKARQTKTRPLEKFIPRRHLAHIIIKPLGTSWQILLHAVDPLLWLGRLDQLRMLGPRDDRRGRFARGFGGDDCQIGMCSRESACLLGPGRRRRGKGRGWWGSVGDGKAVPLLPGEAMPLLPGGEGVGMGKDCAGTGKEMESVGTGKMTLLPPLSAHLPDPMWLQTLPACAQGHRPVISVELHRESRSGFATYLVVVWTK